MKKTSETQWCVCQICQNAFFIKDEENIHCKKCGNSDQEAFSFETELEDEYDKASR